MVEWLNTYVEKCTTAVASKFLVLRKANKETKNAK